MMNIEFYIKKKKKSNILFLTILAFTVLFSCKQQHPSQKKEVSSVQVKTVRISKGYLPDFISITGTTIYMNKNTIVAPISGYVTKVTVQQGDIVAKGKVLFVMQSPEGFVMQQNSGEQEPYGLIPIKSPTTGFITGLNVTQKGVFIGQGTTLCFVIGSNDLKVKAAVPFEWIKYVKIGSVCKILLPDSALAKATFSKILPQMNTKEQTIGVLADMSIQQFIPENLMVNVLIEKSTKHEAQILPKSCLMTDALMTKFWVMKLINRDVAVKVPVKIGNQTHTQVEILSPTFRPQDQIISEGAYGLSDTTLVEIIN